MFKVIIVEDDMLYRHEIRNFVEWEKYGFTVIGEAVNGEQALNIIARTPPDLVFTDISMPGMNGIALIQALREKYPQMKIVVLTSYDDFNFVRGALKLGAEDYILKYEIAQKEFIELLSRMEKKLLELNEEMNKDNFLKENKYRIAHEYLRGILSGQTIEESQLRKNLKILNLTEKISNLVAIDIRIYPHGKKQDILFMNRESIEYSERSILLKIHNFEYVVLCVFEGERSLQKIYEKINEEQYQFVKVLKQNDFEFYSIGISNVKSGWNCLKDAYEQAVHAAERKFYEGYGKTIFYSEIKKEPAKLDEKEYYQNLRELLSEGRMDTALNRMHDFFRYAASIDLSKDKIHEMLYNHLILLYKFCIEEKIEFEKIADENNVNQQLIDTLDTRDRAESVLREYVRKLKIIMNQSTEIQNVNHKKEVYWIKNYIEKNYMNDINLELLSEELNFTPSYICKIFKKNTGIRITEYLNQVRIEHAKRLIKKTNLKVYEISEMVGFARASYFCTVFKEITGIKVSEYKNSL